MVVGGSRRIRRRGEVWNNNRRVIAQSHKASGTRMERSLLRGGSRSDDFKSLSPPVSSHCLMNNRPVRVNGGRE